MGDVRFFAVMWSLAAPHDQPAFCRWGRWATTPVRTN